MNDDLVDLGVSTRLFAFPKPPDDAVVLGGEAGEERWTRIVTRRVAHTLWYYLTVILYPERQRQITTRVATAAFRSDDAPTITTHVEVFRGEEGLVELLGAGGQSDWLVRMNEQDARTLWAALDKMLFPLGWEGTQQRKPRPPEAR